MRKERVRKHARKSIYPMGPECIGNSGKSSHRDKYLRKAGLLKGAWDILSATR